MLSGAWAPSRAVSSAAVSTAHTYGSAAWASSQRATNCGAAARVWISPYPAVFSATRSRWSRGRGGSGPFLLCRAEYRAYPDDRGQVQHLAFPRV